jgi:hypothetical protein
MNGILLWGLVCCLVASAAGEQAAPVTVDSASQRFTAPRVHPVTGSKVYPLAAGLEIDPAAGVLYLETRVCLDSGILEFLVVQGEAKAYESALSASASPSQLVAGALLLKWKPGDELSILALHGLDTIPLDRLLHARSRPKGKSKGRPDFRWKWMGSNLETLEKSRDGLWADREGIHIALVERQEALVQMTGDLKNPYHNSAFGYEIRPGQGISKGKPILLLLRKRTGRTD